MTIVKNLTELQPMTVGDIVIETPLTLAPMAGHTNHAYRRLVREIGGCGLVCTELLSSNAMSHDGSWERTHQLCDWTPDEAPFAVQLFGNDPQLMADAARRVVDAGANIVDINMGCWVPKVAKKGGGAALLRDVCAAQWVVEAVARAVDVPVTVKVRSGFEMGEPTAIRFAVAAEQCGAAAIAVHARYASQGFSGHADWDIIRQVKAAVQQIPVIGNGDVLNAQDAARMLDETGCDGVMLGRAALGQPWIFAQIAHELRTGEPYPTPTRAERAAFALRHAHLTLETTRLRAPVAVRELRGQLATYKLDEDGTHSVRNQLVRVNTLEEIEHILLPLIHA